MLGGVNITSWGTVVDSNDTIQVMILKNFTENMSKADCVSGDYGYGFNINGTMKCSTPNYLSNTSASYYYLQIGNFRNITHISNLTNDGGFITSLIANNTYLQIANFRNITHTSNLTNDAGYVSSLTANNTYLQIANNRNITRTSNLTNDAGFISSTTGNATYPNKDTITGLTPSGLTGAIAYFTNNTRIGFSGINITGNATIFPGNITATEINISGVRMRRTNSTQAVICLEC
jgi:hypothetical protein